jgi:hypothetical protein
VRATDGLGGGVAAGAATGEPGPGRRRGAERRWPPSPRPPRRSRGGRRPGGRVRPSELVARDQVGRPGRRRDRLAPWPGRRVEFVLVHRLGYDDWSFPKGKLHPGETEAQAAPARGPRGDRTTLPPGREVGTAAYRDPKRRPKAVRYWEMTPTRGTLGAANEIDDARWVPLREAPGAAHLRARPAPPGRLAAGRVSHPESSPLEPTTCSPSRIERAAVLGTSLPPGQPPSRRAGNLGRTQANAAPRRPAAGRAGEAGSCGRRLAAAGDASSGAPPGTPRHPTRSKHGYLPFLQVMVDVMAWGLPPRSPWRVAPRPPRLPSARSRPGPGG